MDGRGWRRTPRCRISRFRRGFAIRRTDLAVMLHDHVFSAAHHGARARHQHLVHAAYPSKTVVVAYTAFAPEFASGVSVFISTAWYFQ